MTKWPRISYGTRLLKELLLELHGIKRWWCFGEWVSEWVLKSKPDSWTSGLALRWQPVCLYLDDGYILGSVEYSFHWKLDMDTRFGLWLYLHWISNSFDVVNHPSECHPHILGFDKRNCKKGDGWPGLVGSSTGEKRWTNAGDFWKRILTLTFLPSKLISVQSPS